MDLTSSLFPAVVLALLQLALVRTALFSIRDEMALHLACGSSLAITFAASVVWPLANGDFGLWPMTYLATFAAGLIWSWYQRTRQLQQAV